MKTEEEKLIEQLNHVKAKLNSNKYYIKQLEAAVTRWRLLYYEAIGLPPSGIKPKEGGDKTG